jgi:hypothetical protein
MKETYQFEPEDAAFRTELIGNLKINRSSEDSKRLLGEWADRGQRLVESGVLDLFAWNKEEARVYAEAGAIPEAIWVLKLALIEAIQQGREEEIRNFTALLEELGADPDDLGEVYGE